MTIHSYIHTYLTPEVNLTSEAKMKVLNGIEFDKNQQTFQLLINHANFSKVFFYLLGQFNKLTAKKISASLLMNDCRSCFLVCL